MLVAIAAILSGVGLTYRIQRKALQQQAPEKPKPLSTELSSSAEHWEYHVTNGGHEVAYIEAEGVAQVKDASRVDLKNVTLRLQNADGTTYNLVKSAEASFFTNDQHLYSEGAVEITLKIPNEGQPGRPMVLIRSSGVTFNTVSGHAETDRASSFEFEHGTGSSTGAVYDPASHELLLKSDAVVNWKAEGPHAQPMKIEGASLAYHEDSSEVWLKPWGKLTRGTTVMEGNDAIVHLQDSVIRRVEAVNSRGTDEYPDRKLAWSAARFNADLNEDGELHWITGTGGARLVSTATASQTTITSERVDLSFVPGEEQGMLNAVQGAGHVVLTSEPRPVQGRQPPETHILRSEAVEMRMRPGGREVDSVITKTPGTVEFIPNLPVQHRRKLEGREMTIQYGAENRIESFRATEARTETEPTADERKRNRASMFTSSRDLRARFDTKTSRLDAMEQTGDFSYQEGDRRAQATRATLDSGQDVILLDTAARMWDPTGSTSADRIRMDQKTGDFTAEGRVRSTRMPDRDSKKNSQMLSGDQPLEAQARRLDSTNRNRKLRYQGGAVMWQGANRIQGDTIDVDREKRTLAATGNVVTNLWEEKQGVAPALTVVRAASLLYSDENRLAHYTGGVALNRPGLSEKCAELRAFLADSGADSRLDKAFAEGTVEIIQTAQDRRRTGTGEHSEYYTAEQKVILRGNRAKLVDTVDGVTEGDELTYFANDDRLLVNGTARDPGKSRFARKRK